MTLQHDRNRPLWAGFSPWMVIGSVLVLLPIFIFMTLQNINRQKENSTRLLLEKGAALIRSFEAGTRTGMMGGGWQNFQLQRLLHETAQQPDIAYLFVVDANGRFLAHSETERIGRRLDTALDLQAVAAGQDVRWRLAKTGQGETVFEVFRGFRPVGSPMGMMHRGRMMHHREDLAPGGQNRSSSGDRTDQAIFIGLDMKAVEESRRADTRHTLWMASVLLLIGFAGILLLLMAQNYRAARASLRRVQAFSDHLVQFLPMALVAVDAGGKVAYFNRVAGSILGRSPREALGKDVEEVLPGELRRAAAGENERGPLMAREFDCQMPDGRVVPLELTSISMADARGRRPGRLMIFRDQTEIRSLRREIARSQRLASVGRLAAGVAHEVRNPLSSIKGFATYFKERYRKAPEDQQIADLMIGEVDRLNRVIGQLLDFARPIRIRMEPVSVSDLLERSLRLVDSQAEAAGVAADAEVDGRVETFSLDPDRIRQVLLNLHLNAIEAMENGGRLHVSARPGPDGAGLEIRVTDTGAGIDGADLAHVMDPYFTTKSTGTGLGLAIVHNIVEAHGGKIRIESRPGQGTTAVLSFPGETGADRTGKE